VGAGANEIHKEYDISIDGVRSHIEEDLPSYTCFLRAAMAGGAAKWGGDFHPEACKPSPSQDLKAGQKPDRTGSGAAMGSITVDGKQLTLHQLRRRMAEKLIEFAKTDEGKQKKVRVKGLTYIGLEEYAKTKLWNVDLPGDEGKIEGVFLNADVGGLALSLVLGKPVVILDAQILVFRPLEETVASNLIFPRLGGDESSECEQTLKGIMAEDPLVICHNGASDGGGHFLAVIRDPDAPDMGVSVQDPSDEVSQTE
jgi:hypothetical protein